MSAVTTEQLVAVRNAIADLDRFVKASRAEDIGELMVAEEFAIATMVDLWKAFAPAMLDAEVERLSAETQVNRYYASVDKARTSDADDYEFF